MKKIAIASLALATAAGNAAGAAKTYGAAEAVPGEVLVKFKKGQKAVWLEQKSFGMSERESFKVSFGEFATVKFSNKHTLESALKELNGHPAIEYAEPNYIYRAIGTAGNLNPLGALSASREMFTSMTPNDPMFGDLWGLVNTGDNEPASSRGNSSPRGLAGADVNALGAWESTKGSRDVKIAVIDTGVDYNHPDLRANMWVNEAELNGQEGFDDDGNGYVDDIHGYDFANNDGDPMDGNGHGTHCSGTIAAEHDNGIGIAGVMAQAQIVAVKFLTDAGSGSTADAVKAVDYATTVGVDIMSNSWGGGGSSQALKEAIERAKDAGIVFTAAAGNSATDNNSKPHYPSNYDVENVISVAAHNYADTLASFSCYGSRTVHVAAPGRNILSTVPGDSYEVYSGTSMATPHVTGVVGLYIAQHGRSDVAALRENLMSSSVYARAYGRKTIGGGRVDAYNFLNHIVTPRPATPDPDAWVDYGFSWESEHPYAHNSNESRSVTVPGARHVRVIVKKFDIESNYDFLKIVGSDGQVVDAISGSGEDYVSEYVDGDTVEIRFESDHSVGAWGYQIEAIQYIP